MATTVNVDYSHSTGGIKFHHLKLTAGGADSSVAYTFSAPFPILLGLAIGPKTTGSAGALNPTYVESTGVLTISCSASDVVRVTAMY